MSKKIFKIVILVAILCALVYGGYFAHEMYQFAKGVKEDTKRTELFRIESVLENGDIIFQTSKSSQSKAIQIATKSKYSHIGIIYRQGVNFYVYEAVQPVKLTKLSDWINRGEDRKYVVKRLKNSKSVLTLENQAKMKSVGDKFMGKDYDIYFEWSDDKIYCSELVWKIYKEALDIEVGHLETLKDFDLKNQIVKDKMIERYGNKIPMEEIVISPSSIFNSENLETILNN